jgi:hypothetical protein
VHKGKKKGKVEMVVGKDIGIADISGYIGKALVGCFNGKFAGIEA